jgi:hypothetical protein
MYASNVLPYHGSKTDSTAEWGNFAANIKIPPEDESADFVRSLYAHKLFALRNWSASTLPRSEGKVRLWHVTNKDEASSITIQSGNDANIIPSLMSFLAIDDITRKESEDILISAAKVGITSLLLVAELLKCSSERPESYTLKTGEITLDYLFDKSRVSCVFNEEYGHIMYFKGNEIQDEYFERPKYTVSAVRDYLIDLLERVKKNP